ncbi:uncharacterized protein LOC132564437 [Ylistrum balloti]|uniref:uncharacterized protein LOC132564437 n=1 Tax=Ylistrum balloti TaxID=509963 RepID=UPI002905B677|nr:uncharacterized protein LOC132564437 [Ylistrum balloti]
MLLYQILVVTVYSLAYSTAYPRDAASVPYQKNVRTSLQEAIVLFVDASLKNLGKKISVMDRRCDVLEANLKPPDCVGDLETCQNASLPEDLREIKPVMEAKLKMFTKTLNTFLNDLRKLRAAKDELRRRALNTTPIPIPTTTTDEVEESGSAMQGDAVDDDDDYSDYTDEGTVSCPPGWILITGFSKCYYVSKRNEKANWKTAQKFCSKRGGKLVEIKTDAEAAVLKDAVIPPLSVYHYAYVGRRKMTDSNTWVFLSNEEPVDLSVRSWHKPEVKTRNDCGCVSRDSEFNMVDCVCTGIKMYFICEK